MATKTPPPDDLVLPPGAEPGPPPPGSPMTGEPQPGMPPPSSQPPTPDGIPPPSGSAPMTPTPKEGGQPKEGELPPAQVTSPAPQMLPPSDAQYAWFALNPKYSPISASLARYHSRGTLSADGTFTPEGPGTPVINSSDGSFGVGIPA